MFILKPDTHEVFSVFWFQPEWKLADPICTFVFSLIVMVTTFKIFLDIINVLMEGNLFFVIKAKADPGPVYPPPLRKYYMQCVQNVFYSLHTN